LRYKKLRLASRRASFLFAFDIERARAQTHRCMHERMYERAQKSPKVRHHLHKIAAERPAAISIGLSTLFLFSLRLFLSLAALGGVF